MELVPWTKLNVGDRVIQDGNIQIIEIISRSGYEKGIAISVGEDVGIYYRVVPYYRFARIIGKKNRGEIINLLEEEARQLDCWADESLSGGWSTHQVEPMRKRAEFLRVKVKTFKV